MSLDKEKLVKILNLTASDIDGECLSAIRMANKLIKKEGKSWTDLISISGSSSGSQSSSSSSSGFGFKYEKRSDPPPKREQPKHEKESWESWGSGPSIDEMFEACLDAQPDNDFLNSIHDYYAKWHRLSPKQEAALRKFYERVVMF